MYEPRLNGSLGQCCAGLLLIPPAVGYLSDARGGDLRTGLLVVLAAAIVMLLLHIALALRPHDEHA